MRREMLFLVVGISAAHTGHFIGSVMNTDSERHCTGCEEPEHRAGPFIKMCEGIFICTRCAQEIVKVPASAETT
jgi:hypothetical protein